jgi:NADH:ubiquinone oxidoreductase subunit 6 (subunit J)
VTVADALMLALGVIAVGAGALVVTSSHLVRAGLYLVISLGAIAGLYLVLGAELVAWVQVLVYVGAVVVLLLFAVMLTRAPIGPSTDLDRPAGPAALIGAGVGFGLAALLADAFHWTRYDLPPTGTADRVGAQIFGGWVLPFEVLSILLLAALVGAIVLSRPDLGARPDPEAEAVSPAPPTDPTTESAEVMARLERIAARQADAQARQRQTAAEQRAAAASTDSASAPGPASPGTAGTAVRDTLKGKAADVIFGAQARRIPLGAESPADDVIEGTATESTPRRPARNRPAVEGAAPESARSARGRPAIEGTDPSSAPNRAAPGRRSPRPAIEGTDPSRPNRAAPGRRSSRPAIEGTAIEGSATEMPAPPPNSGDAQPVLGEGRPRSVTGPAGRPALPARDNQADQAGQTEKGRQAGRKGTADDQPEGDA